MFESGVEFGGYIGNHITYDTLSNNKTWYMDTKELQLKDNAHYIVTLRACKPDTVVS